MKKILLLFTVLCAGLGYAQNWQTIRSNYTHFFKADDFNSEYDPVLAMHCDSADFVAGDSILYPFQSIRENIIPGCSHGFGPGWLGHEVIIKSDGSNIFYNQDTVSILIETQAQLGTIYKMYTFPSGDSIMAEVTSVGEEMILGSMDSVKTYSLTSNSTINVSPAEFKISKNHGLITILPFYSFPSPYDQGNIEHQYHLVGQENPTIGVTRPTMNDIYDIEIGDEISYAYHWGPSHTYYNITVLSKTPHGTDSVMYEMDYQVQHVMDATGPQNPGYVTYSTSIDTEYYDISTALWSIEYPGEGFVFTNGWGSDQTFQLRHSVGCGYQATIFSNGAAYDTITGCMDNWHGAVTEWTGYSGGLSYYGSWMDPQVGGNNWSKPFHYKSNSGITCGTQFFVSIPSSQELNFDIYPNPVNETLFVESNSTWTSYSIISLDGKILDEGIQQSSIDVSTLPPGIFILQLTTENGVTAKKFVKD